MKSFRLQNSPIKRSWPQNPPGTEKLSPSSPQRPGISVVTGRNELAGNADFKKRPLQEHSMARSDKQTVMSAAQHQCPESLIDPQLGEKHKFRTMSLQDSQHLERLRRMRHELFPDMPKYQTLNEIKKDLDDLSMSMDEYYKNIRKSDPFWHHSHNKESQKQHERLEEKQNSFYKVRIDPLSLNSLTDLETEQQHEFMALCIDHGFHEFPKKLLRILSKKTFIKWIKLILHTPYNSLTLRNLIPYCQKGICALLVKHLTNDDLKKLTLSFDHFYFIQYCRDQPEQIEALAQLLYKKWESHLFSSNCEGSYLRCHTSLLYCCIMMMKDSPDSLIQFINNISTTGQSYIMTAAACIGNSELYKLLENNAIKPAFDSEGRFSVLDVEYSKDCLRTLGFNKSEQLRLLSQIPDEVLTHASRSLLTWVQETYWHSKNKHLNSSVDWRLLSLLVNKVETLDSIFSDGVQLKADSQHSRVWTSAQCCCFLNRPDVWSQTTKGNSLFLQTVLPLAKDLNLKTEQGFIHFIERLLEWSPPLPELWNQITCFLANYDLFATRVMPEPRVVRESRPVDETIKRTRPEWISKRGGVKNAYAKVSEEASPLTTGSHPGFVTRMHSLKLSETLEGYFNENIWYKYKLVAGFLQHARPSHVSALLIHWQAEPASSQARQWLFNQQLYPSNALHHEHINCNVLLNAAMNLLPDSQAVSGFPSNTSQSLPSRGALPDIVKTTDPDKVFGRTSMWIGKDQTRHYLKVQSNSESNEQFRLQCCRQNYIFKHSHTLGLKSTIGEPMCVINSDGKLALYYKMPPGCAGDVYATDPELSDIEFQNALSWAAGDVGKLWAAGINPPDILSAYHNKEQHRKYQFLGEITSCTVIGRVDSWLEACKYPNVGATGLRDHMDAKPANQLNPEYFSSKHHSEITRLMLDGEIPADYKRVRLHELAKTAWGLALLCGHRYCQVLKSGNEKSFNWEENLFQPLSLMFSEAFEMDKDECFKLMEDNGLLVRSIREMKYWMNQREAPFLKDTLDQKIPGDVYPELPAEMKPSPLSENYASLLSEQLSRPEKSPHLGVIPSCRNPLLAFNTLVVKMLTAGSLQLYSRQDEPMDVD